MPDTRDWKKYNDQLVRRGEVYITLDFMENWDTEIQHMNEGKRGRPFIFPHSLITFLGFLHVAFLPYRQMEGFLRKLSQYIPRLRAADYSTICKRMINLELGLAEQNIPHDVIVALDATGMKVSSRGDWMRHKWKVHRGWILFHNQKQLFFFQFLFCLFHSENKNFAIKIDRPRFHKDSIQVIDNLQIVQL